MGFSSQLVKLNARSPKILLPLLLGLGVCNSLFADDVKRSQDQGFSLKVPVDLVIIPHR
jgi:hypothetical protein